MSSYAILVAGLILALIILLIYRGRGAMHSSRNERRMNQSLKKYVRRGY